MWRQVRLRLRPPPRSPLSADSLQHRYEDSESWRLCGVKIGEARSLQIGKVAWRLFLAFCLCRPESRSWLSPLSRADNRENIANLRKPDPSIACWRDHSAGASRRRAMPMPRGNRPSMAAFTSVGERKASEIVMLTCRTLHFSRVAICSTSATVPVTISSSQRRPRSDGRHKRDTRLRTNWANIVSSGYWCNNLPAPSQCVLFPRDIESGVVCFSIGSLIALSSQFDRESLPLALRREPHGY